MRLFSALFLGATCGIAFGQMPGSLKAEEHPSLSIQQCTKAGGCKTLQRSVTIDMNWRWIHKVGQPQNCYTGNSWDTKTCPDPVTCAQNCEVGSATSEYTSTYGVHADGSSIKLNFVTQGPYSKNVGSRNYLMEDDSTYQLFKLKNKEFAFEADVSQLPCGLNGALYFVAMDADGGMSKFPGNKAGAKYGVGYCDAQCPQDLKFINGEANILGWNASGSDTGTGKYGNCCQEMDIWESNMYSTAYTAHSCSSNGPTRCEGTDCGNGSNDRFKGLCDKNGCDIQTYRLGKTDFWGPKPSFDIDSTKPVTVVTQFITEDGTDTGALKEIRRHYVQNGKKIETPTLKVGSGSFNSITKEFCEAEVGLFKDNTNFLEKGGLASMDAALTKGMVLVMSLWDDHAVDMLWLDSDYPTNEASSKPGVARGTCTKDSGKPDDVEKNDPNSAVTWSNIRFGEIGSTDNSQPGPSPPPSPSGCPGGSLSACMALCPSDAKAFKACVQVCEQKCKNEVMV